MWQRFRASFRSIEHLRDWVRAVVASALMALCVGAFLVGWFVL